MGYINILNEFLEKTNRCVFRFECIQRASASIVKYIGCMNVLIFIFACKNWRLPEYHSDRSSTHIYMHSLHQGSRTKRLVIYFKYSMRFMNEHQSEIVYRPSNDQISNLKKNLPPHYIVYWCSKFLYQF